MDGFVDKPIFKANDKFPTSGKTIKIKVKKMVKNKSSPTESNKLEIKHIKNNITRKNITTKNKEMPTVDSMKSTVVNNNDHILHVIENYKSGGISVLENLNKKTLNDILNKTNDVYRNLAPNEEPLISDNQYDILEDYIKKRYPKNNIVGKIGAPVSKNKIRLPYEMASMDKIKPDTKALPSWKTKYSGPYTLSCKLDGVSGLYTTENENIGLYTRGDGKVGQDVSHLVPYLNLPKIKDIVVRGEFIMKKNTFNTKYATKFANARNLIAGTVNRITINDTINDMDFVGYEVIKPELKPSEQINFMEEKGFITVRSETKDNITNDLLSELLIDWRNHYDYEIDGIIVTDDKVYSRKSGNPDHSFAFKMALSEQMAEAKVLDVEWNASKDGYLKPKVRIEPIKLGGVKIEKATGFNGAFIESNKIGVGAVIQIIRSGDVIPYIRSVITPAEQPLMPTVNYVWNDSHVDIMLENKNDDENVRNRNIIGFFKGIEVDKLGDKNVIKIIDAGFDTIPKILKMTKELFLTIDGFKDKMANNIYNGIKTQLEKAPLSKIMSSSNVFGRGFSDKKIELILSEYSDILTSDESETTKIDKLSKVKGMAKKTAETFVKQIPHFLRFLQDCNIESKLIITEKQNNIVIDESNPLYKKSVIMSGTRDKDIEHKLKEMGVVLGTSVTSKTFLVITPEPNSDSSKVVNAKKLNILILTPKQFKQNYNI
jgi:DNA ligase (NAD+)